MTASAEQQALAKLHGIQQQERQQQEMCTKTATGYQRQFSLADGQALLNESSMSLAIGQ
jgi:ferric-dicitrate binding protein FerR (iron transport regulator)